LRSVCVILCFGGFLVMQKITYPTKSLAAGCQYRSSAATNVQLTWREFGWLPLAELAAQEETEQTFEKAKTHQEVCNA
jgi:hypothetical protein